MEKTILKKASNKKSPEILWYQLSVKEVSEKLVTDPKKGLAHDEVQRRAEAYGKNLLPEQEGESVFAVLVRQFKSPLVYILLFAAFITLALREFSDLTIILAAVVVNVIVGFTQENRAKNTLEELKKVVKPHAKVLREGTVHQIESFDLVPGDVVILAAGDRVPADARLFACDKLEIVEAALTGESEPSVKNFTELKNEIPLADRENMVFMGTEIAFGKGRAIVVGTGKHTEIGAIAQMLAEVGEELTPLQQNLARFSKFLAWVTLGLSTLLLIIGLIRKLDFFEMLVTAVAVAVAAIPEGLLISMTVILAIGMQRVLRRRGLVRHLASAETLGSTSVICTDKTGTLTMGEMHVVSIVTPAAEARLKKGLRLDDQNGDLLTVIKIGALTNEAIVENVNDQLSDWKILGSPTDKALLIAAAELGLHPQKLDKEYKPVSEIPFNEKVKYAASIRESQKEGRVMFVKGAPEIVLGYSDHFLLKGQQKKMTDKERASLLSHIEKMTSGGLRVLGTGFKKISKGKRSGEDGVAGLVFTGFIGLKDPVREEVPETIKKAQAAGLNPVIITGDHKLTTLAIATEIGLQATTANILEGKDLDRMDDNALLQQVDKVKIYSRVTPAHKLRIIEAWQKKGEVVAMTGDGVNDAPALQKADIGMSLGSGTEVAKQASDIVLLDNNFKTIVAAIEEGRIIFNNIRKVIVYLLSDSFSQIVLISGAIIVGLPIPILPAMILWTNLITDGLPNLAFTVEPGDADVMKERPRKRNEPLVNSQMRTLILWVGLITDLVLLVIYFFLVKAYDLELTRTLIFAVFGFNSLIYAFSIKNLREPIWKINIFNNNKLIGAVLLGIILQLAAIYLPPLQELLSTVRIPLNLWWLVVALSAIKLIAIEITKGFYRWRNPVF